MGGSPHNPGSFANASTVASTQSNAPVDEFCETCQAKGRVEARYDDPWQTPITLTQVEIQEVGGGIIDSGGRTKGLVTFGQEDGNGPVSPYRPDTGSHDFTADTLVPIRASLVPEGGAAAQIADLEAQIIADVEAFTATMQTALEPWITEWENSGWFGFVKSLFTGIGKGLQAWWDGEGEFWSSVGDWFANLPDLIEGAWESASEAAKALWQNRDKIWALLEGLAQGSVEAIERGLETLRDAFAAIPSLSEVAELLTDLVDNSVEWAGAMIELAVETKVLKAIGMGIIGVLAMIPPNFYSDVVGQAAGFLIPEIILAIIFAVIAYFTAGTGGTLLAARLTTFVSKVRRSLNAMGRAGQALLKVFKLLDDLAGKVKDIIKALRGNIDEVADGVSDGTTQITRRSRGMRSVDPGCFDAASYARRRAPGNVKEQRRIMSEYDRQLRDQAAGLNDMTVGEYLAGRDAYRELGRSGLSSGNAQQNARDALRGEIVESITDSNIARGMDLEAAEAAAQTKAQEIMGGLAALHDPDMVAGGQDVIERVGDRGVNSSIGGSWGSDTQPSSRIAQMDAAARAAAADPNIGPDAKMNVKLEPCRGRR